MFSFKNDYSELCHPAILEALSKANHFQHEGYGLGFYCQQARELIKNELQSQTAEIHFVTGGTQANLLVISALLRPHESVISAQTGHITIHEAGAIEATGHKINMVETTDGKLTPAQVQYVLDNHQDIPHQVKPKLVYISNSTEIGTIYLKSELEALFRFCKSNGLYLFLDGARLGSALTASNNTLSLADIAQLTDIFYIGGTKNGALLGEAIVINNSQLQEDFGYHVKQRGALLAKGELIGIQFLTLFQNNLYFNLAGDANEMATQLTNAFMQRGYSFLTPSTTNQIFPILPNTLIEKLTVNYAFYIWQKINDTHSVIRLVTSWATPNEVVNRFINELDILSKP